MYRLVPASCSKWDRTGVGKRTVGTWLAVTLLRECTLSGFTGREGRCLLQPKRRSKQSRIILCEDTTEAGNNGLLFPDLYEQFQFLQLALHPSQYGSAQ